eukprot:1153712-Pelagomonas_calceolata.AAC.3
MNEGAGNNRGNMGALCFIAALVDLAFAYACLMKPFINRFECPYLFFKPMKFIGHFSLVFFVFPASVLSAFILSHQA